MNLTETPDIINYPSIHYVFVESIGPFMETAPAAWQTLHKSMAQITSQVKVTGALSLYKMEPQMVYRAGVAVEKKPESLPQGFKYEEFKGGKYSRFVLTGPYSQLPEACGRVFGIVKQTQIPVDNNYFIENYVNDPSTTPEEKLITEILIPTK